MGQGLEDLVHDFMAEVGEALQRTWGGRNSLIQKEEFPKFWKVNVGTQGANRSVVFKLHDRNLSFEVSEIVDRRLKVIAKGGTSVSLTPEQVAEVVDNAVIETQAGFR